MAITKRKKGVIEIKLKCCSKGDLTKTRHKTSSWNAEVLRSILRLIRTKTQSNEGAGFIAELQKHQRTILDAQLKQGVVILLKCLSNDGLDDLYLKYRHGNLQRMAQESFGDGDLLQSHGLEGAIVAVIIRKHQFSPTNSFDQTESSDLQNRTDVSRLPVQENFVSEVKISPKIDKDLVRRKNEKNLDSSKNQEDQLQRDSDQKVEESSKTDENDLSGKPDENEKSCKVDDKDENDKTDDNDVSSKPDHDKEDTKLCNDEEPPSKETDNQPEKPDNQPEKTDNQPVKPDNQPVNKDHKEETLTSPEDKDDKRNHFQPEILFPGGMSSVESSPDHQALSREQKSLSLLGIHSREHELAEIEFQEGEEGKAFSVSGVESLPSDLSIHAGAATIQVGASFFIFGGKGQSERHLTAMVYQIPSRRWYRLAPMPWPRSFMTAVSCHGNIYLVGGSQGDVREALGRKMCLRPDQVPAVLKYNISGDCWESSYTIDEWLQCPASVSCDGYIYVSGGYRQDESALSNTLYSKSCDCFQYRQVPRKYGAMQRGGSVESRLDKLVAEMQQRRNLAVHQSSFDQTPRAGWKAEGKLHHGRYLHAMIGHQHKLYMIGGRNRPGDVKGEPGKVGMTADRSIEEFDPVTGQSTMYNSAVPGEMVHFGWTVYTARFFCVLYDAEDYNIHEYDVSEMSHRLNKGNWKGDYLMIKLN